MNKKLLSWGLILATAFTFTACSDDDDEPLTTIDYANYAHLIFTAGAGNYNQNNGTVGALDADANGNYVYTDIYQAKNQKGIGDAQDVLPLSSEVYVACTSSSKIEILNNEGALIKAILKPGVQFRYLATDMKNVYVSAYNGYVYKISNHQITDSVKVGGNPEAMSVANNKLYVNMSDYNYDNSGKSISVIDLSNFTKTKELECELNPYNQSVAVGNYVYFVSTYHADRDGALQRIDTKTDKIENLNVAASAISYDKKGNSLVCLLTGYDANWTLSVKSFFKYNLTTGAKTKLDHSKFTSPQQVNVDPLTGNIFVIDNPSYTAPSSLYVYKNDGTFLQGPIQMGYSVQNVRFLAEAYK